MQDVTTLQFMRVVARYGGPMFIGRNFSAFTAIHDRKNGSLIPSPKPPTGRPVIAQLIGNDIPALVRNAKLLQTISRRRD